MTAPSTPELSPAELFSLYPKLAGRVTDLRGILQNIDDFPPTEQDCINWAEDVKSVMHDYMHLCDLTAATLRRLLPQEPSHDR